MYRIVFLDGPLKGQRLVVREPRVTVGSAGDADLRLLGRDVVSRHAEIVDQEGRIMIRRLEAGALLRVGAVAVGEQPVICRSGDVVALGRTRFRIEAAREERLRAPRHRAGTSARLAGAVVAAVLAAETAYLHFAARLSRRVADGAAREEPAGDGVRRQRPESSATDTAAPCGDAVGPVGTNPPSGAAAQ